MLLTWTQNDGIKRIVSTKDVKFLPVINEAGRYRLVINGNDDVWRSLTQEQADAIYEQLCAEYNPLALTLTIPAPTSIVLPSLITGAVPTEAPTVNVDIPNTGITDIVEPVKKTRTRTKK